MKKCKGCGIELQTQDTTLPGYIKALEQDYCMRCFRLSHYGDISDLKNTFLNNQDIVKAYGDHSQALFVLITDVFDGFNLSNDEIVRLLSGHPLLLVITKNDLLPRNLSENRIDELFLKALKQLKGLDILDVILTYKDDQNFDELFRSFVEQSGYQEVIFVGYANAGKSSLINRLLKNDELTTSIYPGTTLALSYRKEGAITYIDTPGLDDEYSYYHYLPKESLKKVLVRKTIKPQVYQAYEDQSYFVEGLLRIDIETKKNCTLVLMINNELNIHRCKMANAETYQEKHLAATCQLLPLVAREYHIKGVQVFYLKGLGLLKVKGDCTLRLHRHPGIRIYNIKGVF